ncbi:MAG: pyridoxamine 5'-phosphate oxidase family protein [Reichenbachiella sp.]
MCEFQKTEKNKVVRGANRAKYEHNDIHEILDDAFLCHIAFNLDGEPFMIPTAYARRDNKLLIHGSYKSRFILAAKAGIPLCFTVTHLDGLVLARSAFHHSVNYRCAIIYGVAKEIQGDQEKNEALRLITENMLQGRWDEVRHPNQKELDITTVLEIEIDSASAKVRTGGPVDDKEDYELNHWAGELPILMNYGQAISDEKLREGIDVCPSVNLAIQNSKA